MKCTRYCPQQHSELLLSFGRQMTLLSLGSRPRTENILHWSRFDSGFLVCIHNRRTHCWWSRKLSHIGYIQIQSRFGNGDLECTGRLVIRKQGGNWLGMHHILSQSSGCNTTQGYRCSPETQTEPSRLLKHTECIHFPDKSGNELQVHKHTNKS